MFPIRSRRETAAPWLTAAYLLGGLLLLYYLAPLAALLLAQPPGEVLARLGDADVLRATGVSLASATVSTVIATLLGVPLAYWLARTRARVRTLVTAVVVLPLVLPPVVGGMVLLTVVGRDTLLGSAAAAAGLPLTGSLAGVVLAQTFVASPFVVVTAKAAFESVDRHLEHASRTLGKPPGTTFRRVTLPLAAPGILAGVTLAFARSMGEFGATLMLAYYPRTLPVEVWVAFSTQGLETAFPVAVVLVGVAVVVLAVLNTAGSTPWD